jgi:hypothetical protein
MKTKGEHGHRLSLAHALATMGDAASEEDHHFAFLKIETLGLGSGRQQD